MDEPIISNQEDANKTIRTILSFLELTHPNPGIYNHSVTIDGLYGESCKITKTFNPSYYSIIQNDSMGSTDQRQLSPDNFTTDFIITIADFVVVGVTYTISNLIVINKVFKRAANSIRLGDKENDIVIPDSCLYGHKLIKPIGDGSFGSIYLTRDAKGLEYAMKIIMLGGDEDYKMTDGVPEYFVKEMKIITELNNHNIGPKLYKSWYCGDDLHVFGFVVTERWSGELPKDECLSQLHINKLLTQIRTMHELGYVHGDVFARNILVKRNDNRDIVDVTLTDFGSTDTIDGWKKQLSNEWGNNYYDKFSMADQTRKYFTDNTITVEMLREDPRYLDFAFLYHLQRNIC